MQAYSTESNQVLCDKLSESTVFVLGISTIIPDLLPTITAVILVPMYLYCNKLSKQYSSVSERAGKVAR